MEHSKKQTLKKVIFFIYLIFNLFLTLKHEPWRDEIHPWLMDKNLNILELFKESKFDGNPILWNLILYPFVKLNFNILTLNIISFTIVSISAYIFLFKTDKFSLFTYSFFLFTIPFTYIYSSIARNYCLLLLFSIILATYYPKRYDHPIIYSILICFLIHTHAMAWGLVAGLTITFHIFELSKAIFKKRKTNNLKYITIGFILIVINTIIVLFEFLGNTNSDYYTSLNNSVKYTTIIIIFILSILFLINIFRKTNYKEFFILVCAYSFMVLVFFTFYSSIIFSRRMLIYVYLLFYLIIQSEGEKIILNRVITLFFIIFIIFSDFTGFLTYEISDIIYNFSSAKDMANYINQELSETTQILTLNSVKTQTLEPYLLNCKQYDIVYNQTLTTANISTPSIELLQNIHFDTNTYKNNYILVTQSEFQYLNSNCILIYESPICMIDEQYFLYYIK